jgi:hypothetical protein
MTDSLQAAAGLGKQAGAEPAATSLLQQACCNKPAATSLLQQACCNKPAATSLLQQARKLPHDSPLGSASLAIEPGRASIALSDYSQHVETDHSGQRN